LTGKPYPIFEMRCGRHVLDVVEIFPHITSSVAHDHTIRIATAERGAPATPERQVMIRG